MTILASWSERPKAFVDALVDEALDRVQLEPRDRGFVCEMAYGVVRHRNTVDQIANCFLSFPIESASVGLRAALHLGIYQLVYLGTPPHAAVSATCDAFARAQEARGRGRVESRNGDSAVLNAVLRRISDSIVREEVDPTTDEALIGTEERELDEELVRVPNGWVRVRGHELPEEDRHHAARLAFRYSHPTELVRIWLERYDEPTLFKIFDHDNRPPALFAHVRADVSIEALVRKLETAGVVVHPVGEDGSVESAADSGDNSTDGSGAAHDAESVGEQAAVGAPGTDASETDVTAPDVAEGAAPQPGVADSEAPASEPVEDTRVFTTRTLRLENAGNVPRLPGFETGDFWIQDVTAHELASLLPARPGATLWDVCSAPGGKLATYLDRAEYELTLSTDVSDKKLRRVAENLGRLRFGDRTIEFDEVDSDPDSVRLDRQFDQIVVDAPCSNSGVFARRHEARWRFLPEILQGLQKKQRALLRCAVRHLAPGGDLLYTTCSIEPGENHDLVHDVLRQSMDLQLVEEREVLPGENGGDGGYAARFVKRS